MHNATNAAVAIAREEIVATARVEIVEAHATVVQLQKELGVPRGQLCKLPRLPLKLLSLDILEQHISKFDDVASKTRAALAEKAEREANDPIKVMMARIEESAKRASALKALRVAQQEAYRYMNRVNPEMAYLSRFPKDISKRTLEDIKSFTQLFITIAEQCRPEVEAQAEAVAQAAAAERTQRAEERHQLEVSYLALLDEGNALAKKLGKQPRLVQDVTQMSVLALKEHVENMEQGLQSLHAREIESKRAEAKARHERVQRLSAEYRRLQSSGRVSQPFGKWIDRQLAEPMRKTG